MTGPGLPGMHVRAGVGSSKASPSFLLGATLLLGRSGAHHIGLCLVARDEWADARQQRQRGIVLRGGGVSRRSGSASPASPARTCMPPCHQLLPRAFTNTPLLGCIRTAWPMVPVEPGPWSMMQPYKKMCRQSRRCAGSQGADMSLPRLRCGLLCVLMLPHLCLRLLPQRLSWRAAVQLPAGQPPPARPARPMRHAQHQHRPAHHPPGSRPAAARRPARPACVPDR